MTTWFVHRNNGVIDCIYQTPIPGYSDEAVDDTVPELAAFLLQVRTFPDPSSTANLPKVLKAVLIAAALLSGRTAIQAPPAAAIAFTAAWNSLP